MADGTIVAQLSLAQQAAPIRDAIITITKKTPLGLIELLAVRTTDENGKTGPVSIETPQLADSLTPQSRIPWTNVDITAEHPAYNRVIIQDVQVFANTNTLQTITMIPQDQYPQLIPRTNVFTIPPYSL